MTEPGDKVWIIEEDGTHTPAFLIRRASVWPGACTVQPEAGYAALAGVDAEARLWPRRNVIDHETGERLR